MSDPSRARLSAAMAETELERQARTVLAELDAEEQRAAPQESRFGRNLAAAGELALMALPITRVGRAMFSTLPRAAASAAGIGTAGAAVQHAIAPAEAADGQSSGGDLDTVRTTIGRLRSSQGELHAERQRLSTERLQFDKIDSGNRNAVAEAQRRLGLKPDGNWGPDTSKAIAAHKANVERQISVLNQQATRLANDLEGQTGRLTGLEGNQLVREAEESVGPVRRFVREAGPWAGVAAGLGFGMLSRRGAVRKATAAAEDRARSVNAMLPVPGRRAPPADVRVSNINDFYRQGGAGEAVPFAPAQTARGFKRNPGEVASASSLYPSGPKYYRGSDYAVAGGFGAEAAVSGGGLYLAHQELREAEEALAKEKNVANVQRVQRALDAVALAETLMRAGLGGAVGRLGVAPKMPYRTDVGRPNIAGAEAEVLKLNKLLKRKR